MTPAERPALITNVNAAFGSADWYKNLAKADIDTHITANITENTPPANITALVQNTVNKQYLDTYFTYAAPGQTTYESAPV